LDRLRVRSNIILLGVSPSLLQGVSIACYMRNPALAITVEYSSFRPSVCHMLALGHNLKDGGPVPSHPLHSNRTLPLPSPLLPSFSPPNPSFSSLPFFLPPLPLLSFPLLPALTLPSPSPVLLGDLGELGRQTHFSVYINERLSWRCYKSKYKYIVTYCIPPPKWPIVCGWGVKLYSLTVYCLYKFHQLIWCDFISCDLHRWQYMSVSISFHAIIFESCRYVFEQYVNEPFGVNVVGEL